MAENIDKNISQTQSSFGENAVVVSGEEIRPDLLISEEQIDATFDSKLKEEIAAQTLILTALSRENGDTTDPSNSQVQQLSNNLQHQHPTVDLLIAAQQEQVVELKEDYGEQENNDLTFVSETINAGVEMIAIQQQQQQVSEQSANILVQSNSLNQGSEKDNHGNNENSTNASSNNSNIFNQQLVAAGTLLESGLTAPVVLNAIAIKGENGGVTEIQFDNNTEIQMEQTEVESVQEENNSQDNNESSLTINPSLGISTKTDPSSNTAVKEGIE